ncbi:MAG TPA: sulfite exporter TauE/SafE family protein [Labilithrix sp.]|nr:sulfite exporter TauE/SafE family protein [Labilithrix sp.]
MLVALTVRYVEQTTAPHCEASYALTVAPPVIGGVLSLFIGAVLGALGGGGAILTLPMLVYVVGVEPKAAIALSLFVVGSTSVVGAAAQAMARRVRWKVGGIFGTAAMVGAFVGGRFARFVPARVLLVTFAIVMLLTGVAMLRGRSASTEARRPLAPARLFVLGGAVGMLAGLVGAGGGFLIVPALTLFGGLAMREAIGTSLFVIALQCFAGFAGHIGHVTFDASLAGIITGAAVVGTLAGTSWGSRASPETLRRAFGWIVLAMGLFVLGKQLEGVLGERRPTMNDKETKPCTTSPQCLH